MKLQQCWQKNTTVIVLVSLLVGLSIIGWTAMGQVPFVRTILSGLTLGSLYLMVAAGLTLIFGLMDVLNFAHGAMFMVGAYIGWQFYTNPTFLSGLAPLILAVMSGLAATSLLRPLAITWPVPAQWQRQLQVVLTLLAVAAGVFGVLGLDLRGLADTAMVSSMVAANPLAEATPQEPLARFWLRPTLLLVAGLLLALAQARPGDRTQIIHRAEQRRGLIATIALLTLTVAAILVRESAAVTILKMNANWRFALALLTGMLIGGGIGAVMETSLVRPLYVRPFYLVISTLGLAFVLKEVTQFLWDPLAYQMDRPPLFAQPGKADSILAWFSEHTTTVNIMGATFPSYRLFIIALGATMLLALLGLMRYTRLGMIIRAGVQDREMVEALGINVQRVFTLVFALGVGLAALGGIGAAPFIPVEPIMGDRFMMQGFITVVLGGMGSISGAAVGALLLGLARAFGDYLALKFSLTPAISEASTVIIMAIVLLVQPSGLFGKKD